ncbi:hypothetical protein ACJIZ3_002434 [Penstemon smallii]|uniref:DUF4378 domain-containing protein n=1 Tax=Penstemon smallii TaxID=265156 RepID=A0ABD3U6H3_9LAMI
MGSLFRLLDIREDTMAKKVVTHKRYVGGLEAPRNSLDIPVETSYGLYSGRDNILYAYHVTNESSEKNRCSTEAPMKKLISEEISKRPNTRHNSPSVVARLMGVDMLPLDSKATKKLVEIKSEIPAGKFSDKERSKKSSVGRAPSTLNSSQRQKIGTSGHDSDRYSNQISSRKPKPREHPQEEELQKFKKEFEAWQTARFKECSKVVEFSSAPSLLIAQEDLNRERMFLYANSKRVTANERVMEPKDQISGPNETRTSHNWGKNNEHILDEMKESVYSNRRPNIVSGPTKIVILRPGPEKMGIGQDSWNSTPSSSEERGSIEEFLEEVKERLKSELQGESSRRSTSSRGGGIETPYREKPPEPRQIAQRIAQQVRDSVTRDLSMNLLRSESTRSYRSDVNLNGTNSPEYVHKDTRRLLTERLRNVLKVETHREVPMVSRNSSRSSVSDYEKQIIAFELEKQSRSFRRDSDEGDMSHMDMSPRNLVRSMSAPVSGTSFGKLLLEDRNILTGAQIRRKHESIEKVSMNVRKQKKDKFNIKDKVSSFRYSLTLRGRLFRRRVRSIEGSFQTKHDLMKDISSGPTVTMSFYETHENYTEVPPSPASVCSSAHEEFWRSADYLSPTSSSSVHQLEDNEMPHVFREINSNLNELRRKLNQFEGAVLSNAITEQQPDEVVIDIEDQDEAYIRDLLVASGLYDGSCHRSLSKWDPLGKPISNQVFEEVEESYQQNTKEDEISKRDEGEKLNHKLLLDLLNEALPVILKPPINMSRYMEKAIGPVYKPPHGRRLLFHVWEIIRAYIYPPTDRFHYSLDTMLTRDLKLNPWFGLIDEDMNALGRDIECLIYGDLIDEMMKDM